MNELTPVTSICMRHSVPFARLVRCCDDFGRTAELRAMLALLLVRDKPIWAAAASRTRIMAKSRPRSTWADSRRCDIDR
jgi:hypothetical protein